MDDVFCQCESSILDIPQQDAWRWLEREMREEERELLRVTFVPVTDLSAGGSRENREIIGGWNRNWG